MTNYTKIKTKTKTGKIRKILANIIDYKMESIAYAVNSKKCYRPVNPHAMGVDLEDYEHEGQRLWAFSSAYK